jgi:hypothetical protein
LGQTGVVALIIALTTLLASIGPGIFARLFFMIAAVSAAIWYLRRSPWEYVTLTFWFWTTTGLARRLIDWHAGFDPANFVLGTPSLLTLLMLKDILGSRELLRLKETFVGLLLLFPILYGIGVSFVKGDVVPGAAGAADWLAPVLYYFFFIAHWRRIDEAEPVFRGFLAINGLLILLYTFWQFAAPSPWDLSWYRNAGIRGEMRAGEIRLFGPLNATPHLALWLASLLLLSLHFRSRLSAILVPAMALLLLMTYVRAMAGAAAAGLVVAGVMGRAGTLKVLGIGIVAVILVGGVACVVYPDVFDDMAARFGSVTELGKDDSALARRAVYEAAPAIIDANPLGVGLAAIGRGAVAATGGPVIIDSGPLAIYLSLGWIGGSMFLAGVVLVLAQATLAARQSRSSVALAVAVTALAGSTILFFTMMTEFFATVVWTFAGYASAIGIAFRQRPAPLPLDEPSLNEGNLMNSRDELAHTERA